MPVRARHPLLESLRRRPRLHLLVAVPAVAGALLGSSLTSRSAGDLQSQIDAGRSAASTLRAEISADAAAISRTSAGLHAAQARLSTLTTQLGEREAALRATQTDLLQARDHLVALENRLRLASKALAANLVASYEGQQPSLVSVILNSHGFVDLLEQMSFLQRIGRQDASVVTLTRTTRAQVAKEVKRLAALEVRDRTLTSEVLDQRNQVAALQAALLGRQIAEERARSDASARLGTLNARLTSLERRAAAQAAAAAAAQRALDGGTPQVSVDGVGSQGIALDSGGMVQPPAGAPAAVAQVIAAGNAIATLPYIWGGGHGSFQASGYDCSGSVSYALAAAGLLSSPMDSTGFMSYGDPGPGRWITIYANPDHVWMQVAGWRFDTVAQAYSGTRWAQGGGEFAGFVVRHPPGL